MSEPADRRVWDLPVRVTHWLLVAGIAGSYLTNKLGVNYFKYHLWFGYLVLVLAAFRIVWGVVGTRHARFTSFVRGPRATFAWLRSRQPTPGHNPLGAWMVVFLLLALLAQAVTGLFANDEIFNTGPLYGYIGDSLSLALTSWHRRLFDWILIAALLHVLAVFGHRVFARHDLIGPMFTGRKSAALVPEHEAIDSSRLWLAAVVFVALVATVSWLVAGAPEPAPISFE